MLRALWVVSGMATNGVRELCLSCGFDVGLWFRNSLRDSTRSILNQFALSPRDQHSRRGCVVARHDLGHLHVDPREFTEYFLI